VHFSFQKEIPVCDGATICVWNWAKSCCALGVVGFITYWLAASGRAHRVLFRFGFGIPVQSSLGSFEIPYCKVPRFFCVWIAKTVAFGIGGAQMEASLMYYLGTCGTPRICKGEGVKFLLA
jgi:hypothetical protein